MRILKKTPPPPTRRERHGAGGIAPTRPTYAYHARRSDSPQNIGRAASAPSRRILPRHLVSSWQQRFGAIVLLVAAVVCMSVILTLSSVPKIVIAGNRAGTSFLQDPNVYQQTATKILKSSLFNGNKITVDTASVRQAILAEYPEVQSVVLTVPLISHRPIIYIQPVDPTLLLNATNGTFVIDSTGRALGSAANLSNLKSLHLPQVTDQSAYRVQIGQYALSSSEVSFIKAIIYELNARQQPVSGFSIPAGTRELDASLAGRPYFVKFNLQSNNPRQQAGTLLAMQHYLATQNVTPSQYIDVRVDGRAYFK